MSTRTARRAMRPVTTIAVLALAAAGLVACGDADDETNDDNGTTDNGDSVGGAGLDDGTELTMWTRAPLEAQANRLVEAYNAAHENQIRLEIIPNDDMEGRVGAAATNDDLPDLLAGDVVRLPYWVDNGLFTDLTDHIEGLDYYDDIATGHIDAGTTVSGTRHTVPFVTDISVMVWNKDLYREAGLDPEQGPTTLEEYKGHALAISELDDPNIAGTYFGGNCGGCLVFTWFPMIWASGEEVLSADGTESLLDSEAAIAVYDAFAELNEAGALGAGSAEETGATWVAPFQEGNIGVMPYPNTVVASALDAGIDVGVGPISGIDGGESTFLGGDAMGISKDSANVEQAWHFLQWMLSEETQLEVVAQAGDVPARISLLDNEYTAADPLALIMNATVEHGRTPVAANFSEAFNAPGSPWVTLVRNATLQQTASVAADNEQITATLQQ